MVGVMTPFLLVVFGAIVSSFLIPRLFEGDILVWPQKIEVFSSSRRLLRIPGIIPRICICSSMPRWH